MSVSILSECFFQVWDVHDPYSVLGGEKAPKSGESLSCSDP